MNLFFVFEGKTEPVIYKSWLSILLPDLTEVKQFSDVNHNNYYYESDMGLPDCYNIAVNAIQDINTIPKYDYLILVLDSDRLTTSEREQEARTIINEKLAQEKYHTLPSNCNFKILVQNVCIETWLLGNRKFFVRNPQSESLKQYINYFDVSVNDPEELANEFHQNEGKKIFDCNTKAQFHVEYFRELFKERMNGRVYSKSRPYEVNTQGYFEQLLLRVKENTGHLLSFQEFIRFCDFIK